ncbi:MAG: protein-S-isoprenylcysteine O-methyltransferase Ste14 [Myxococcota bacterium]|jgi:protein-S-isoprenylcysteine O-methyltransferase Ste14
MRLRLLGLLYGVVCHGLFVLAIGAMIGNLYAGMQWGLSDLAGGRAWGWDALLLVQFPLLHSLLLTRRGGRAMRRLAPAVAGSSLDTTLFATVAALQVLAVFVLWAPLQGPVAVLEGAAGALMSGGFALGWLLLVWAMGEAGMAVQTGSAGWTALWRGDRPRYPRGFPSQGMHARCRHPIYASFALILWTGPVWSIDRLLLAIPLTAYCVLGPKLKEARIRRRNGEAYDRYAAQTPALLPRPRWLWGDAVTGWGAGRP